MRFAEASGSFRSFPAAPRTARPLVFVESGRFADEHDARMRIPHTEHHLSTQLRGFALLTVK
jgi:hypothetical protein